MVLNPVAESADALLEGDVQGSVGAVVSGVPLVGASLELSLIHISEPTRRTPISYAVFCLTDFLSLIHI